jgi:hypothetical protein
MKWDLNRVVPPKLSLIDAISLLVCALAGTEPPCGHTILRPGDQDDCQVAHRQRARLLDGPRPPAAGKQLTARQHDVCGSPASSEVRPTDRGRGVVCYACVTFVQLSQSSESTTGPLGPGAYVPPAKPQQVHCPPTYLPTHVPTYLPTYLPTHLPTYQAS